MNSPTKFIFLAWARPADQVVVPQEAPHFRKDDLSAAIHSLIPPRCRFMNFTHLKHYICYSIVSLQSKSSILSTFGSEFHLPYTHGPECDVRDIHPITQHYIRSRRRFMGSRSSRHCRPHSSNPSRVSSKRTGIMFIHFRTRLVSPARNQEMRAELKTFLKLLCVGKLLCLG